MMGRIFYDTDTQIDFFNEDGKLYIPGAKKIKPNLKKLTKYGLENNIKILGSADRHFLDDKELEEFPPHCMDGTLGAERIEETRTRELRVEYKYAPGKYRKKNYIGELKDEYPRITIEKQTTDVFSNPHTEKVLRELGVEGVAVYGGATDYCVKDAVLGMLDRDIDVYLIEDAMVGIDEMKSKNALEEMKSKGAVPITTKKVLGGELWK